MFCFALDYSHSCRKRWPYWSATSSAAYRSLRPAREPKNRRSRVSVLVESNDGGVYKRTQPASTAGGWLSLNGNLQSTGNSDASQFSTMFSTDLLGELMEFLGIYGSQHGVEAGIKFRRRQRHIGSGHLALLQGVFCHE